MMIIDENRVYWHGRIYSKKQVEVLQRNSFRNMDKRKHKELSSKGGKASAESKALNKANELIAKEYAKMLMDQLEI